MPKVACRCGNVINLSEIPNKDGYLLLSETAWDQIEDAALGRDVATELLEDSSEAYLCPHCGRLIVFWGRNRDQVPRYYMPEPQ